MRFVIDVGTINERGTSVACYDYARFGEEILGNDVIIAYRAKAVQQAGVFERFTGRFHSFAYTDNDDLVAKSAHEKADVLYRLMGKDEKPFPTKGLWLANHAIFRVDTAHGDVFAYVSEWLSDLTSGGVRPFVPHIIDLPEPGSDLRKRLGIPQEACVIGRHGGYDQFNLPFLKGVVEKILEERPDVWFVFLNTKPFVTHQRVIYLPATSDLQEKSDYINACDAMLHARKLGESFGLAMGEFLYFNKPVICWYGGIDRNHLRMQRDPSLVYYSAHDLLRILRKFQARPKGADQAAWLEFRRQYSPETVMRKFNDVFLTPSTSASYEDKRSRGIMPSSSRVRIARRLHRRAFKIFNEASIAAARLSVQFPMRYSEDG